MVVIYNIFNIFLYNIILNQKITVISGGPKGPSKYRCTPAEACADNPQPLVGRFCLKLLPPLSTNFKKYNILYNVTAVSLILQAVAVAKCHII